VAFNTAEGWSRDVWKWTVTINGKESGGNHPDFQHRIAGGFDPLLSGRANSDLSLACRCASFPYVAAEKIVEREPSK
jgi:hypothetical protein